MISQYPQIETLRHGLVASCQAAADSPLNSPQVIAALAKACEMGGAIGFRVDHPENVAAVRSFSRHPIIGINKIHTHGYDIYITPSYAAAEAVVRAGADLVAIQATGQPRPDGETFQGMVRKIHDLLKVPVMADVGNSEQGLQAIEEGADLVATTFGTSAPYGKPEDGPALHIVRDLVRRRQTPVPIVVEGQIWTVEQVKACFDAGAFAIVVGSAITAPQLITQRFVSAIP